MRQNSQKWALAASLLIALLGAIGVLGAYNIWRVDEHRRWVAHTQEVIAGLEHVLSLARDAESGQRGYVITGEGRYLEPYNTALTAISSELDHLEALTVDNAHQKERFPVLRQALTDRLDTLRANLLLRQDRGLDAARESILTDRGRIEMERLQDVVRGMIDHERELFVERTRLAETAYRVSTLSHIAATIAAIAGIVISMLLLRRELAARAAAAREIAEHAERLRTTLASIGDGVIATDGDARVTMMNGVAESLTGWTIDEARGEPLDTVFRIVNEETRRTVENPAARALRDHVIVGLANHTVLIAKDGSERPIDDSAAPIRCIDGEVVGCVLVFRDVTDRKLAETAMRDADRRKDEFLATLAHELRNPLAPIRNAVQFLLVKGSPDPESRWSAEVIERQVRHMARLLDDLLDVSRITHNKLELRRERVELAPILRSAVETSRPLLEHGSHELSVELPPDPIYLDADPVRLAQVFANLLNNAAKYTEPGGHVRLVATRRGDSAVISVRDDGIGIDAELLPRLFEIFAQSKRVIERSQGGLGVGLSLVRGLVDLHGGRIEAKSDGPGTGSEFVVHLPIMSGVSSDALVGADGDSRRSDGRKRAAYKILIVDDVKDGAESLAILLRSMGHEVRTAFDGESAIALAEAFEPDVVLLDIGMPTMSGYDVCREIRGRRWGKRIHVVALTGWSQADDRRSASEAGFDHHMVKPLDAEDLALFLDSLSARSAVSPP